MRERKGAIDWMAHNPVAANLLMAVLLIGGLIVGMNIRQEVFPDFKLDLISVQVPYPGAAPSEVEQGVVLALEEAVRGVDGVKRVNSTASEGHASLYVELHIDRDPNKALTDVKNAVDAVTSLPEEAERPLVNLVVNRVEVISVILHGPDDPLALRQIAEDVREELLSHPLINHVDLVGAAPREVSIEVPGRNLRAYGLTLPGIADRVGATALELSGGAVKTSAGEVLLRTAERRDAGRDFRDIPIVTTRTGGEVTLGDIATVRDDFAETDEYASYDGRPALMLRILRSGEHGPIEIAAAVKEKVQELRGRLPAGVEAATWVDWSETYRERVELLVRNGAIGLILVLGVLGLFLELRLAFWVTMGIPVSFLGGLMLMPTFDVTINMISLFAFIVTLGMVVDDAIVVGENVFRLRQAGEPLLRAAVKGAREVAVPVTFSIATTVTAFTPMFFVPGFSGKLFRVIPTIVITVLAISLIESLFILPAHLGHLRRLEGDGPFQRIQRRLSRVSLALERFVEGVYSPFLKRVLRWRYVSMATGLAFLMTAGGVVAGGHIAFRYMPNVDGDVVIANVEMSYGSSLGQAKRVQSALIEAAERTIEKHGGRSEIRGVFAQVGKTFKDDPGKVSGASASAHLQNVQVFLSPAADRDFVASAFARVWRDEVGPLPGLESITFKSDIGPTPGRPIDVELTHGDLDTLEAAAGELGLAVREFAGVRDIDDGFARGKPRLDFTMKPEGASLGITSAALGRQVRGAFYGAEALRQQEGRNEVRVVARLPESERRSVRGVENLLIRTPSGGDVPLAEIAHIERTRSRPSIRRTQGRRVLHVSADVVEGVAVPAEVLAALEQEAIPDLMERYPGLAYDFAGENREQTEVLKSLVSGGQVAMLVIFALLAIPFKSYVQPLVVMAAIPFGIVGAVIGHLIMGFELSIVSSMGLVALAGVVVNDSLVLIDAANRFRRNGMNALDGIHAAGVRRFRPILLTSLTTFFGLTPMILETSVQARFLVPMAISLGFGVLFATFIILLLVPAFYMIIEDIRPGATAPGQEHDDD